MIVVSFVLFAMLIFAWLAAPDWRAKPAPIVEPSSAGLPVQA
jgi:hypothetical protein